MALNIPDTATIHQIAVACLYAAFEAAVVVAAVIVIVKVLLSLWKDA